MAKFDMVEDEEFVAFTKNVKEEEAEKEARKANGGSNYTPEDIKWVGLEQEKMAIVRLLGKPPRVSSVSGIYDMHEIFTSEIKDDDGKVMKLNLPIREDTQEQDHFMWRMIDSVMKVAWVKDPASKEGKSKKVYENEFKFPEIFNKVSKGGFDPEKDKNKYTYSKGMMGQKVLVANAIVRSMNAWHKEHKHSVLLSKNVTLSDDGTREYANIGIASYGFVEGLSAVSTKYGSLEKYDLGITRTGQMNNPYKIINASRMVEAGLTEELDKDAIGLVTSGSLTEEELNYDRYEIGRLFKPTSYSKLKKRLGKTIKMVDSALKTVYYDELCKLSEIETAENVATKEASKEETPDKLSESAPAPASAPAPKAETPVRARAPSVKAESTGAKFDTTALKGWEILTPEQKAKILDIELDGTKVTAILYDNSDESDWEVACPECGLGSPQSFSSCPSCGKVF